MSNSTQRSQAYRLIALAGRLTEIQSKARSVDALAQRLASDLEALAQEMLRGPTDELIQEEGKG